MSYEGCDQLPGYTYWKQTRIYLVPVLLHAALCSLGKCLTLIGQHIRTSCTLRASEPVRPCFHTFAISLQLFPASLICLSLCSSAGVHGVLVLLFLGLGSSSAGGGAGLASAPCEAEANVAAGCAAGFAEASICWSCCRLTDFRFFDFPGVGGCGTAAAAKGSWVGATAGWRGGRSAEAAKGELCCGFAAIGEGFRLRLAAGDEL
jgi:hypothetical protein